MYWEISSKRIIQNYRKKGKLLVKDRREDPENDDYGHCLKKISSECKIIWRLVCILYRSWRKYVFPETPLVFCYVYTFIQLFAKCGLSITIRRCDWFFNYTPPSRGTCCLLFLATEILNSRIFPSHCLFQSHFLYYYHFRAF